MTASTTITVTAVHGPKRRRTLDVTATLPDGTTVTITGATWRSGGAYAGWFLQVADYREQIRISGRECDHLGRPLDRPGRIMNFLVSTGLVESAVGWTATLNGQRFNRTCHAAAS